METKVQKFCRNCSFPLPENAKYCPKCSQKNTDGKVPITDFLQDFVSNLFNIDSKLFLTLFAIFIPGKLTIEYFKGKHKSYASPVRLFLYAGITLFALIISKTADVNFGRGNDYYNTLAEKVKIKKTVKDNIKRYQIAYQDTALYHQSDSLSKWIIKDIGMQRSDADSVELGQVFGRKKSYKFSSVDFINLPVDTLLKKYKVEKGMHSIMVTQEIKTKKDGKGLFHFFFGNLPITIFFMMPFLALVLKVLYARKKNHYFVEHLVFSFHYHTFAFLITMILVLFGKHFHGLLIAAFILSIFIYQFIAMKRYYKQGFLKTFLKFSIINFTYIFLVIFFFIIAVTVSFFLF